MSLPLRSSLLTVSLLLLPGSVFAQDAVPVPPLDAPIGPFVVDVRGALARFKQDPAIAGGIGVQPTALPTRGLGLVAGGHVYPVRTRNFALGVGGEILVRARGRRTIPGEVEDAPDGPTIVTRLSAVSPQLSLNFGKRNGWSYLSGGLGWSTLTTERQDDPFEQPASRVSTINYGGGARWFTRKHLAVSIDLRFYAISPQEAASLRPGYSRTTVMVFSAGIATR